MNTPSYCSSVSDGVFLQPDFDWQEFRHGHPSASGERRAAGDVQTRLTDHHASSGQRGTGESRGDVNNSDSTNWNGIFKQLNHVFVRVLMSYNILLLFFTLTDKLQGNNYTKFRTYDLSLRPSLSVCVLCLGAFDVPPLSSTPSVRDVPLCLPSHRPG